MGTVALSMLDGSTGTSEGELETALTLAEEEVPTSLAAYNHRKVILTTAIGDPRETLKQAMTLVKEITVVENGRRTLQPANIGRLRRDIAMLRQASSQPAQRLLEMLNFEHRAIEEAARKHPATLALFRSAEHALPPATIIMLVSRFNHDAEAVHVAIDKLLRRGFNTMPVTGNGQRSARVSPGTKTV